MSRMIRIVWLEDEAMRRLGPPSFHLKLRDADPECDITWAEDGADLREKLSTARNAPFDALISDGLVNRATRGAMFGHEVIKKLRDDGLLTEATPVLFFTGGRHLIPDGFIDGDLIIDRHAGARERLRDKLFEVIGINA